MLGPDGSKLSKRKHPTSITYYRDEGYLPEALLNYLALMGWSMPDEREIFSLDDLKQAFDPHRISIRGPVFDTTKLRWLNGQYLRALSAEQYAQRVRTWMLNADRLSGLLPLVQERMHPFRLYFSQYHHRLPFCDPAKPANRQN